MPASSCNIFGRFSGLLAVLVVLVLFASPAQPAAKATAFELSGNLDRTEASIALDQDAEVSWFLLQAPHRLVIELPETAFAFDPRQLKPFGLVNGVRYGKAAEGRSRIILTSTHPFSVERLDVEPDAARGGYSLGVTLLKSTDAAFRDAMSDQLSHTGAIAGGKDEARAAGHPFVIVLDPGHGGFDGGAEGVSGTNEKDITLAFAKELRERLAGQANYKIVMTRESDMFLRLDERVKIAQQNAADLFISIHADTIRYKGLRGATVYTGSDRASDAESEALADRENLSDRLAGVPTEDEKHEVADILFEFVRRETQDYSVSLAKDLVGELSRSVGVINNPHRHARFRVLRAPDVPSVLIELGYLSNIEDETSLRDPQWRAKAVDSISAAVEKFAARKGVAEAQAQR
ncbi:MAG: N-acetylmuramoyl-L-alanine amidase [Rhizobiaceae bacterium]|nr:N-acetylmuramoyl-L-alanine amidase [Rhizobiaceae bacterium]